MPNPVPTHKDDANQNQGHTQRTPRTINHPGEHITAQLVGAAEVLPIGGQKGIVHDGLIGVSRRNRRSKNRHTPNQQRQYQKNGKLDVAF